MRICVSVLLLLFCRIIIAIAVSSVTDCDIDHVMCVVAVNDRRYDSQRLTFDVFDVMIMALSNVVVVASRTLTNE